MRITLNDIGHDFGDAPLFSRVTCAINPGDRIGIVGPNGSGKTALVRIITGDLEPVSGTVVCDPDTRIGFVPQHLEPRENTTVGELLLGHIHHMRAQLRELEEAMSALGPDHEEQLASVLRRYERAREPYDAVHGDAAEDRAARLLAELGLPDDLDREIRTLSGGERNVLSLSRALVDQPNVLVMDEPGNHLDFAGLAWLESYLGRFDGAVIVVSHNRYLLDKVATSIWEVFSRGVTTCTGNYSDFRFTRLTQAISDQATWSVQQHAIARLEALVQTFEQRARTTGDPKWGKRLNARRTQLAKARELAMDRPEIAEKSIQLRFANREVKSDIAIEVNGYSRGFGDVQLFRDAGLLVHVGERVGIVGPNGCGKTTFLTDLVTRGSWDESLLRVGPSMQIGFCAQQRDRFPDETSVLDAVLTQGDFTRNEVFSVVSRLLFDWSDLERPVGSLSGGEWNRLQLAMAIIAKANLLVLDEPTNHLDIRSREAVEKALSEFDGTIIAVSHDRYFLDAAVDRIAEIRDRRFVLYAGTFSEYWFERAAGNRLKDADLSRRGKQLRSASGQPASQTASDADAGRNTGSGWRADGGLKAGGRLTAAGIEAEILRLEEEQRRLEHSLAADFGKPAQSEGRKDAAALRKIRARIDELYNRWADL